MAARRHGLAWARSRVAQLERGEKALPAEELALLPSILTEACRRPIGLSALIDPDAVVSLSSSVVVDGRTFAATLAGTAPEFPFSMQTSPSTDLRIGDQIGPGVVEALPAPYVKVGPHWMQGFSVQQLVQNTGETEVLVARRLGVPLVEVAVASARLWQHSFSSERDRRVTAIPDVSPHRLSALRGRVTRKLTEEIRAEINSWDGGDDASASATEGQPDPEAPAN